jgi:outer membrane protein
MLRRIQYKTEAGGRRAHRARAASSCAARALLAGVLASAPLGARAESLLDAIQMAYATNPDFRAAQKGLAATGEGVDQARAQFGPQVSVTGGPQYQAANVQFPPTLFSSVTNQSYSATTESVDLSLVQPLYTFGKNRAGLAAAEASLAAGREGLRSTEASLILRVITAYCDVLRDREAVQIVQVQLDDLTAISKEIAERGRLGDLSRTDVAQSEARLLAARSQLAQSQGSLSLSNAEYLAVVGHSPGDLEPVPELTGVPDDVDTAFDKAEAHNGDLQAAIATERAAHDRIDEAKSANGPNVAVRLDAGVAPYAAYIPNQYQRDFSAQLVLTQPIFTSGFNSSKIREAVDRDGAAELKVEQTRRQIIEQVSQAWDQAATERSTLNLVTQQLAAEQVAFEGNKLEAKAGLRTTIDLLNAEGELAAARLAQAQARHDGYVARASLLAAIGELEAAHFSSGREAAAAAGRVGAARATPPEDAIGMLLDRIAAPSTPPSRPSTPGAGGTRPSAQDLAPQTTAPVVDSY